MTENTNQIVASVVQRHLDAICQELYYKHKIEPSSDEMEKLIDYYIKLWMKTGDTDD